MDEESERRMLRLEEKLAHMERLCQQLNQVAQDHERRLQQLANGPGDKSPAMGVAETGNEDPR